jgi:hypothetical protein
MGKNSMDNAVMINPAVELTFPSNTSPLHCPSWFTLAAAAG